MIMLKKIRNRLVYKLIFAILFFSGCLTLVITVIQVVIEYRRDVSSLDIQFTQIERSFLYPLSSALWRYNDELIQAQLEGIYQLRDIERVEAVNDQGQRFSIGGPVDGKSVSREFPLRYRYKGDTRELGTLTATASYSGIYSRLRHRVFVILVSSASKTLFTAVFMLILFRLLVIRHLERIASYFQSFSLGATSPPLRLDTGGVFIGGNDELGRIEKEINRLVDTIRDSYDTVQKKVALRTSELERSNQALSKEIGERKKTAKLLRRSEKQYRNLVENSPDIIYRFSLQQGGLYISRRVEKILGYSVEQLRQEPFLWYQSIHPDDRKIVDDVISQVEKGGRFDIEYRLRNREGDWLWFRDRSIGLSDDAGEAVIEGIATDITELKRVDKALSESERKYRLIFDSAPIGIFKSKPDGRMVESNPRFAAIFGYDCTDEFLAEVNRSDIGSSLYLQPEDRVAAIAELGKEPGRWFEFKNSFRHRDGREIVCNSKYRLARDADGEEVVEGFVEDISVRVLAERDLLYYESLVSTIDDMLALVDLDLRYLQVNEAVLRAFGKKRHEVIGRSVEEVAGSRYFTEARSFFRRCLEGEIVTQEGWMTYPCRQEGYYRIVRYPMRDVQSGRIYGIAIVSHDMTQMRKIQEDLARANDRLKAAKQELDQFVYVVSHDLKSPLRAIHNYADFISEDLGGRMSEEIATYLSRMSKAIGRSENMVEDLLEFSRIGRTHVGLGEVDLGALFQEIREEMELKESGSVMVSEDCPTILSNYGYLQQIFTNIIGNGLKFNTSEHKRVDIKVEAIDGDLVQCVVADNGIGIEPRFHEQIFKVFQRLHTNEEFEGTGIGLAIVKKAVEVLGGTVHLESKPGKGSIFTITLPGHVVGRQPAQGSME